MSRTARLQAAAVFLALILVSVFLVSFIVGLGGGEPGGAPAAEAVPEPPQGPRTRVEVLNANGTTGLARKATRLLRSRGFDVVYFGNASAFGREGSVVLDRVGDLEAAREVAAALGVDSVRSEPDPSLLLDVTVLLGLDWPPQEGSAEGGFVGRIRRLLRLGRGAGAR